MPRADAPTSSERASIRFGDHWIPAHTVWRKVETVRAVLRVIDHFNTTFPHLASAATREVLPLVRRRLAELEQRMPGNRPTTGLGATAAGLLASASPEGVIDTIAQTHGIRMDIPQLIRVAGDEPYRDALAREALEFSRNGISAEQTARLWNEAGRPAPEGGLWSGRKIEALLATQPGSSPASGAGSRLSDTELMQ